MRIGGVGVESAIQAEIAQNKAMAAQGMAAVANNCEALRQWCLIPVQQLSVTQSALVIQMRDWAHQPERQLDTYV